MLFVKRLPWYIVAKAVSVFCDVCKQESISWDNRGAGTHMGRSEGGLGGIGGGLGGTQGDLEGNSRHVRPPERLRAHHLVHI